MQQPGSSLEIVRDEQGVPHCFAASGPDAFFAQGWVHAADRLWQMDYDRRRARGRWGEVAGDRAAASDEFHRRIDLSSFAERDLGVLAPPTCAMLDHYTAGVNARIAAGHLGREFAIAGVDPDPWTPVDSILVHRIRHLLMGSARHKLWRAAVRDAIGVDAARRLFAAWNEDDIACVPPGAKVPSRAGAGSDSDGGSNNWVLAGSRTASGMPLMAGDPHRELEVPNVYVQGHLSCPDFDVLGIGMPGVPGFPHFGHNARVAWSITHGMSDDQDVIAFDDESALAPTDRPFAPGLALRWTALFEPNTGFDALEPMLRAGSVDELFETMRPWVEPVNSLLAADVDGHIGYLARGKAPVRRDSDGLWWSVPSSAVAWDGWVPFEDMPRSVDPAEAFLYSANNAISAEPDAPELGVDVASPGRARRIVEALRDLENATTDDMTALQRDVVSLPARRFAALVDWEPLRNWDGSMHASSTAAAAYSVLRRELMDVVFERSALGSVCADPRLRTLPGVLPAVAATWRLAEQLFAAGDVSFLDGSTWDELLAEATDRASKTWTGETWGELHVARRRHPLLDPSLDPSPLATEGDADTVMVGAYLASEGFAARTGSVARFVWDLADWDASGWIVPLGAAGDVADPYGVDQQDAWVRGELVPALYSRAAIDAAATERHTLDPQPLDRHDGGG